MLEKGFWSGMNLVTYKTVPNMARKTAFAARTEAAKMVYESRR